jgi:ribonucleoside-diphosphate reductase alpha chain
MGMFEGVLLGNCAEIVEYTDENSVAVCNLASIALHKYVKFSGNKPYYDYEELGRVVRIAVRNLNKVIDKTHYPVPEGRSNNLDYRPIGLGVQGLADVFALFKTSWESELAKTLNKTIFECMYYYALDESAELAKQVGSYSKFEGSPASQGQLQYHLWGVEPLSNQPNTQVTLDWDSLIVKVKQGLRNSLLIALMPTASSSQLLGSNEAFEPFTSNIYTRSTQSGEFIVVNKYLYKDLKQLGLWTKDIVDQIITANGSVQELVEIPLQIRERYKTVWEYSQKIVIDLAADRAPFVDQTQSMNLFVERPTYAKLSSMHLYGWKKGLKTGCYYIRSKAARDAVKFTISTSKTSSKAPKNDEGCLMCSA